MLFPRENRIQSIVGTWVLLAIKLKEMAAPPAVIDLMAALKRSFAQEAPAPRRLGAAFEKSPQGQTRSPSAGLIAGRKRKTEITAERP